MTDTSQSRPALPPAFIRGAPIRAADFEQIRQSVAFALGDMIGSGPGILVSRRGDRYLISAAGLGGGRGGADLGPAPWRLTGAIEGAPPAAKIRVAPGMVNNFVPTIEGVSIAAIPAPAFTVTGASGLIQIKATVDAAGAITALILESIAGPAVTPDSPTEKYKLVGAWTSADGAFTSVTSILNTNQTLYLCGGTAIWEA